MSDSRAGYLRLQVVVVLVMALLLIGLLIAASGNIRDAASRSNCHNNNRQIALAVLNYHSTNGHFPTGTMPNEALTPEQRLSWMMAIQPHVESNPLYGRTDKNAAWDAEQNRPHTMMSWKVYKCVLTTDWSGYTTNYVGVAGVGADTALLPTNPTAVVAILALPRSCGEGEVCPDNQPSGSWSGGRRKWSRSARGSGDTSLAASRVSEPSALCVGC